MSRHRHAVPQHLAIIMDGNGRWATRRACPRWMGHVKGAQTARERRCGNLLIKESA